MLTLRWPATKKRRGTAPTATARKKSGSHGVAIRATSTARVRCAARLEKRRLLDVKRRPSMKSQPMEFADTDTAKVTIQAMVETFDEAVKAGDRLATIGMYELLADAMVGLCH